jgi:hypothetical protein
VGSGGAGSGVGAGSGGAGSGVGAGSGGTGSGGIGRGGAGPGGTGSAGACSGRTGPGGAGPGGTGSAGACSGRTGPGGACFGGAGPGGVGPGGTGSGGAGSGPRCRACAGTSMDPVCGTSRHGHSSCEPDARSCPVGPLRIRQPRSQRSTKPAAATAHDRVEADARRRRDPRRPAPARAGTTSSTRCITGSNSATEPDHRPGRRPRP